MSYWKTTLPIPHIKVGVWGSMKSSGLQRCELKAFKMMTDEQGEETLLYSAVTVGFFVNNSLRTVVLL